MLTKNCLNCGKLIEKRKNESLKDWETKRKFCCKKCSDINKVGKKIHSKEFLENVRKRMTGNKYTLGVPSWNKGGKMSEEHKQLMKEINTAEKNPNWKGNNAGTRSIHLWVERQKGKAKNHTCEHCKKVQAVNWSNTDHKYERNINHYQALCRKCHERYDMRYNDKYKERDKKFIK